MLLRLGFALVATVSIAAAAADGAEIPAEIMAQVPAGYEVLGNAVVTAGRPAHAFAILALGRRGESDKRRRTAPAWRPKR